MDKPSREPHRDYDLALREPVLCECTLLKCSRGNAASFDAMSRLTGRDFPFARVVPRPPASSRVRARGLVRSRASEASLAISRLHPLYPYPLTLVLALPARRLSPSTSPVFPLRSDESRFYFYIRLPRAVLLTIPIIFPTITHYISRVLLFFQAFVTDVFDDEVLVTFENE